MEATKPFIPFIVAGIIYIIVAVLITILAVKLMRKNYSKLGWSFDSCDEIVCLIIGFFWPITPIALIGMIILADDKERES